MTSDDSTPQVGDWIEVLDGPKGGDEYSGLETQITTIQTLNGETRYLFKHDGIRIMLSREEFRLMAKWIETDWSGWRELE